MSNVFGFSTEISAGGDFIPIIKYNAPAGRIFRIDRVQTADGFASEPVDITSTFKAVADFENIETGWMLFAANTPPSFALVPIGEMMPPKPSEHHKQGVRFMLKLAKGCGGDEQVREIAGQAKAFVAGIEQVYLEYKTQKEKYPGQLPVIVLSGTTPVTTTAGNKKTTNFRPTFKIDGWAKRPDDLTYTPVAVATNGSGAAPSTGGQTALPPNAFQSGNAAAQNAANLDDDFG
jgi:hypothetical protein